MLKSSGASPLVLGALTEDKSVIFSVAGSGKTTLLVDALCLERRFLVLTFTENNFANLRRRIVKKFGYGSGNRR